MATKIEYPNVMDLYNKRISELTETELQFLKFHYPATLVLMEENDYKISQKEKRIANGLE